MYTPEGLDMPARGAGATAPPAPPYRFKVGVRGQPRVIQPQFRRAEFDRVRRVRRQGVRPAAHPRHHGEVGGQDPPRRARPHGLRERGQRTGTPGAGHHHSVGHGQDVPRVDSGVGAAVVGHRVGVQKDLEAGRRGGAYRRDRPLLQRPGHLVTPRPGEPGGPRPEQLLDPGPAPVRRRPPPHGLQGSAYERRQLLGVEALSVVSVRARGAEAERHEVVAGVPERGAADLVVGVQMGEPVPAERLQFRRRRRRAGPRPPPRGRPGRRAWRTGPRRGPRGSGPRRR